MILAIQYLHLILQSLITIIPPTYQKLITAIFSNEYSVYSDRYTNSELKILCTDINPLIIKDINLNKVFYKSQPKQSLFHYEVNRRHITGYREFFFGGSASPGKSTAIRWQAHKDCLKFAGLRVLILRNTFPELQRTHLDLILFDLPSSYGKYNQQKHTYYYRNGSILEFGYIDSDKDFDKYLSANYDIIMFDEGTTINIKHYILLRSRLRASISGFIPYMVVVSNPGSKYHRYYKSYFYTQTFEDDFPELIGDTGYNTNKILYIQAYVFDNQEYILKDPEIINRLNSLPKEQRKRFLEGSWDINVGSYYDFNENIHVINPFEIPADWPVIADIDYGRTSACVFIAVSPDGNFYAFAEWTVKGGTHSTRSLDFYNFLQKNKIDISKVNLWADVNFFYRKKDEDKSKPPSDYFKKYGIDPKRLSKTRDLNKDVTWRINCNFYIAELLHYKYGTIVDENGEKKEELIIKPKLYIFRKKCPNLIKTLPDLVASDHNPDDIEKDENLDHWHDSIKSSLISYKPRKPEDKVKTTNTEYYEAMIRNTSF